MNAPINGRPWQPIDDMLQLKQTKGLVERLGLDWPVKKSKKQNNSELLIEDNENE